MKKILDTVLWGEYTAQDALIVAGVAVALFILIGIIMRASRKRDDSQHFQHVDCLSCGWEGNVSKYVGRCPKCNQPLGEQRARR